MTNHAASRECWVMFFREVYHAARANPEAPIREAWESIATAGQWRFADAAHALDALNSHMAAFGGLTAHPAVRIFSRCLAADVRNETARTTVSILIEAGKALSDPGEAP